MTALLATADVSSVQLHTPGQWLMAIVSIVLIDIVLAGDNAVVIALAVRCLEKRERLLGILIGSGMAVALRVGLTFVAAQLLTVSYIKLAGGLLILWVAVKLLLENTGDDCAHGEARTLWHAIWLIMVADVTMSLDNVLAVAGASKGSFALLLFGLGLSIPLVVFTSNLLSRLMDRYPVIVYLGSALLGKVGGEMIMTDRLTVEYLDPSPMLVHSVESLLAAGVVLLPWLMRRRKSAGMPPSSTSAPLP